MAERKAARAPGDAPEYKVMTVAELDAEIYAALVKSGAAEPVAGKVGEYRILDRDAARSSQIMPTVLDRHGAKGWRLVAVNRMECLIFERGPKVRYRVISPADLDRRALIALEAAGHAAFVGFDAGQPQLEITAPEQARIQTVLPQVLSDIGAEGWRLAAVTGPQLYIFTRPA